jgi:UDP-4-amino-4,6-dideoxy-N-acetyl-beta-L-altrosamine transaminase
MSRPFLGYGRQSIDEADISAVVDVLRSDFLTQGPAVEKFEAALAERTGARYAISVSNGTAALHLACLAADVGQGDLGLTSAITFAASANCIRYVGGQPGFVDIDGASLGMSGEGLRHALDRAPHTKVVVPVHLAGLADGSAEIRDAANGRTLIEDAAHSLGGHYACGKPVGCGAYSDMTTLSFHPVKTITTGEGGAVLTNDEALARRLRRLRSHGIERDSTRFTGKNFLEGNVAKPWYYEQQELGFNYRMTDIQAALGFSQLAKLDRFVARRREIAARYDAAFSSLPDVELPQSSPQQRARSAHHLYILQLDFEALKTTRSAVMWRLRDRGIGTQVHYIPVYRLPYYADNFPDDPGRYPAAERYYAACLSIPMHPGLTDEDVEYVIGNIKQSLGAV